MCPRRSTLGLSVSYPTASGAEKEDTVNLTVQSLTPHVWVLFLYSRGLSLAAGASLTDFDQELVYPYHSEGYQALLRWKRKNPVGENGLAVGELDVVKLNFEAILVVRIDPDLDIGRQIANADKVCRAFVLP